MAKISTCMILLLRQYVGNLCTPATSSHGPKHVSVAAIDDRLFLTDRQQILVGIYSCNACFLFALHVLDTAINDEGGLWPLVLKAGKAVYTH